MPANCNSNTIGDSGLLKLNGFVIIFLCCHNAKVKYRKNYWLRSTSESTYFGLFKLKKCFQTEFFENVRNWIMVGTEIIMCQTHRMCPIASEFAAENLSSQSDANGTHSVRLKHYDHQP
jgi:hypothetical protein